MPRVGIVGGVIVDYITKSVNSSIPAERRIAGLLVDQFARRHSLDATGVEVVSSLK
jgi:hypothetical protein